MFYTKKVGVEQHNLKIIHSLYKREIVCIKNEVTMENALIKKEV